MNMVFVARLVQLVRLVRELCALPVAQLRFDLTRYPEQRRMYELYTKPHPRFRVVRNKTLGIALVNLRGYRNMHDYLHQVRFSGHAGPQRNKALARGYTVRAIDRNQFVDAIHAINISAPMRQGRPMDSHYRVKKTRYDEPHYAATWGAFDVRDQLAAYCVVFFYDNFAATDQLLGYKTSHGTMYLLLSEIICQLIERQRLDFFMYDTFLGARPGLRDFKRRTGFRPYRARYSA
jgi:hypothetical protein